VHEAIKLAEGTPGLREDLDLMPWLAVGPLFLRETGAGRTLLEDALRAARDRAAVGALPYLLNLIARDQYATDRWAVAEATYLEAIDLARESGQQTELAFGLAGLAWLQARRGRERECRDRAAEALRLCRDLGMRLYEIWATAALGDLELGLGDAGRAAVHFERQQRLLAELAITDADLSPAAELTEAYARLGRDDEAREVAAAFTAAAQAKGQPWPLARALRGQGLLAADADFPALFDQAIRQHAQTLDAFETARTRLAYGERLRRARNRVLAREQLRAALDIFEHLGAGPWADRARAELAATGETRMRRSPGTIRRTDTAGAADRAGPGGRAHHEGNRRLAVPEPQDRGVPPPARVPEVRHPLPRRTRPGPRQREGLEPRRNRHAALSAPARGAKLM